MSAPPPSGRNGSDGEPRAGFERGKERAYMVMVVRATNPESVWGTGPRSCIPDVWQSRRRCGMHRTKSVGSGPFGGLVPLDADYAVLPMAHRSIGTSASRRSSGASGTWCRSGPCDSSGPTTRCWRSSIGARSRRPPATPAWPVTSWGRWTTSAGACLCACGRTGRVRERRPCCRNIRHRVDPGTTLTSYVLERFRLTKRDGLVEARGDRTAPRIARRGRPDRVVRPSSTSPGWICLPKRHR